MKKAFLFVLGFLIIGLLTAQPYDNHLISNGEVSPDFSKGDYLSSDVVHLYDYLDSGKTVFIFFFLYDEASGWAYHQSGVLQQLYDTYGPSGNNSIEIIACSDNPYWDNLTGLGDGSQGNWTTDMPYHLINDGGIDGFKLFGTVSVYRICPDRSMFEMGFPTQWALQQSISQCALSSQAFDAKIMYSHLDTVAACPLEMRSGMAFLSNMGTNVLTDVDIKVEANEQEVQSFHWQGNLPKYHVDTIFLDNIPLSLNGTDVKIYTDNPNGIADQNPENDTLNWPLQGTYQWDEDKIYVEVHTDGYGHQIYWDIKGSSGDTLGMGGNGTVGLFDGAVAGSGPGYYYDDWYYQDTIDLTNYSLDCITIRVLSGYGYGTCCTWGNGYIRFKKGNNVIFNYTDFGRRAYAKILPTFNLEALHVGYQLQHTTVGEASGQIGIYAEKGMPPYQYSIDCGQSYQNESTLDSLSAGTYCVSTMDVMGSIVTDTLTIYSIGNLSASYAVTHETNNQNNGSIGITATGGYPPYEYSKDCGQTYSTSNTFGSLSAGWYCMSTRDAIGQMVSDNVEVQNIVGTQEQPVLSGLRLQPNPTADVLQVSFMMQQAAEVSVSVVNVTGQRLWEAQKTGIAGQNSLTIPTAQLPEGVYWLVLRDAKGSCTKRFIVLR